MIGLQYWLFSQTNKVTVDAFADMPALMDRCFTAKKAGAMLVGGGVPKNFILQSMLMTPNGVTYAIQLTGDRPDLGGLSGATLDEARSWGKITEDAQAVTVYGDATITLPMLAAAVTERLHNGSTDPCAGCYREDPGQKDRESLRPPHRCDQARVPAHPFLGS
jgi:deoxyhypusine synthase